MKKFKLLSTVLLTTLSLSIFAGCGGSGDSGKSSASGEKTEITWWLSQTLKQKMEL